ncbi:MAG: outer membrane beta-barrel protein [Aquificaceae bacterium]
MRKGLIAILAVFGGLSQSQALELSGAITGYGFYTDNRTDEKKARYDVGSALLSLSKPAEPIGFTLRGGAYAFPVVGVGILKTSQATDLFSPLPVAYLELVPAKGLSLQVGKLPTIFGYESAFTYLNHYIQRGLIWNMQPVINHGIRVNYTSELFFLKVGLNDGFYTLSTSNPKPAIEGSIGITPTKDSSFYFNFILPDKGSKPNPTANPANKREFNLIATYTFGSLSLGGDIMFVEAPEDATAQVPEKARATAGCIHMSYHLKPITVSGRIEYVKDDSDVGGLDLVGLGDGNRGWTFTLTPAYRKGSILLRGEVSYVRADNPFTLNNKKNQTRLGIEVGWVF